MGLMGLDELDLPDDGPRWWWQVLSGSSAVPELARGRADDMLAARSMVEAAMHANQGALLGMTVGPAGQTDACRRTLNGTWRWMPWP